MEYAIFRTVWVSIYKWFNQIYILNFICCVFVDNFFDSTNLVEMLVWCRKRPDLRHFSYYDLYQ